MSQLNVDAIRASNGTGDAISFTASDKTCTANITNNLSNRNLIINGAMQVAQRGTSVAWAANAYLTCDRWQHHINNSAGRWTAKQTADGPDGFRRCLELDVTTADTSIAANEHALIQYKWEGQDVQQLAKGTAGAKKFTVSFYVKGNGNATYMCEFFDRTNTRLTRQQFSVTSSWSRVTLTFDNETSNGTLNDDNSHELDMMIWLHAGSDFTSGTYTANTWAAKTNANRAVGISSLFSSTDNYFRITGVQVEVGDYATEFEHKSYGKELALCQRYYEHSYPPGYYPGHNFNETYTFGTSKPCAQNYIASDDTTTAISYPLMVTKRGNPTITIYNANSGASGTAHTYKGTGGTNTDVALNVIQAGPNMALLGTVLGAVNQASEMYFHYQADAEL